MDDALLHITPTMVWPDGVVQGQIMINQDAPKLWSATPARDGAFVDAARHPRREWASHTLDDGYHLTVVDMDDRLDAGQQQALLLALEEFLYSTSDVPFFRRLPAGVTPDGDLLQIGVPLCSMVRST